jgi:hypothetical protein
MAMSISKLFLQQNRLGRRVVVIVTIFLAGLIFFKLAFVSVARRIRILERAIPKKEEKFKELLRIRKEFLGLKHKLQLTDERTMQAGAGFDAASWLQDIATELGLKASQAKETLSPLLEGHFQGKVWQLNFSQITLEQLTKYLHRIENQESPVGIKRLLIKKNPRTPEMLDVVLEAYVLIKK